MEFRVCFTIQYILVMLGIHLFMLFGIHFHQSGPSKLIKTILKTFDVLLGLSLVWYRFPNSSRTTGSSKRSIIAYDEIEDRCMQFRFHGVRTALTAC